MSRPRTRRPASPSSPSSPELSTRPLPARQPRPTSSAHEHRLAELRTALDSDPELADALWTVVADLRGRGARQSSRAGEGHAAVEHERGAAGVPSRSRSRGRLPRSPSSPSSGFSSTSTSPERDTLRRSVIRAGATAGRDRRGAARRRDESLSVESASSSEDDGNGSPARPLLARQEPRDEADTGRRRQDSAAGTSRSKSRTTVSGCQASPRSNAEACRPSPPYFRPSLHLHADPPRSTPARVSPSTSKPIPAPSLLPHKAKRSINVDFPLPSDFNSSGLPHFPRNQYLPLRLLTADDARERPDAQGAAEEGRLVVTRRPFHRHEADGGDNILFPALLSFAVVLLPILVLCLVLGTVFGIIGLGL